MNKEKTECWEATLPLNIDKEKDSHPDWKGTIVFDGVIYEAAAWVGTIRKGADTGKPYISLELKNEQPVVNVKLWHKSDGALFEGRAEVLGRLLVFTAWPVPLGGDRHELKLQIADAPSLSEEALKVQRQVAVFLKTVGLSLAANKVSEPGNAPVPISENQSKKEGDSDLGVEPDDIPF
jgi:hypothetical protein